MQSQPLSPHTNVPSGTAHLHDSPNGAPPQIPSRLVGVPFPTADLGTLEDSETLEEYLGRLESNRPAVTHTTTNNRATVPSLVGGKKSRVSSTGVHNKYKSIHAKVVTAARNLIDAKISTLEDQEAQEALQEFLDVAAEAYKMDPITVRVIEGFVSPSHGGKYTDTGYCIADTSTICFNLPYVFKTFVWFRYLWLNDNMDKKVDAVINWNSFDALERECTAWAHSLYYSANSRKYWKFARRNDDVLYILPPMSLPDKMYLMGKALEMQYAREEGRLAREATWSEPVPVSDVPTTTILNATLVTDSSLQDFDLANAVNEFTETSTLGDIPNGPI